MNESDKAAGTEERKEAAYLFWCDLETDGLDPRRNMILEVAWMVTRFAWPYEVVVPAESRLIRTDSYTAFTFQDDRDVDPAVMDTHRKSGLLEAHFGPETGPLGGTENEEAILADLRARNASHPSLADVATELEALSKDWPTKGDERVRIAGYGPRFDLDFLRFDAPVLASRLSHRVFDVTAIRAFCRGLGMRHLEKREEYVHRAQADMISSWRAAQACGVWVRSHASLSPDLKREHG